MFSPDDTIVAVATPPGRGGIGVVRISGPRAEETALSILGGHPTLEPRRVTLVTVVDPLPPRRQVDRVLATYFPAPASYTGENVVELSGHGNPVLLRLVVQAAQSAGARLAEPGEFTLRAFLHGRIDLVQAEAIGDLVDAVTPLQARVAFDQLEGTVTSAISGIERSVFDLVVRLEASVDFPDEGYHFVRAPAVARELRGLQEETRSLLADAQHGRLVREGGHVVVLGKPNVGKSTLFNRLLRTARAIVTDVPGTTRDLLTETLDLNGIPITLVDTAGIRATADEVESQGVERARRALGVAQLVVLVLDRSRPLDEEDSTLWRETLTTTRVVVVNKTDLPAAWEPDDLEHAFARCDDPRSSEDDHTGTLASRCEGPTFCVSLVADDPSALDELREGMAESLVAREPLRDVPIVTNLRHIHLLEQANEALCRAADAAAASASEELVLADLADVQQALGEVTGARTADDVLTRIFSKFCIGK